MRRIRLLVIAIASFFGTIIGEGLVRRAIALLMCGVFSFNSTACYASFGNREEVAIAQIPRVRQQNQPAIDSSLSERDSTVPSSSPTAPQNRTTNSRENQSFKKTDLFVLQLPTKN